MADIFEDFSTDALTRVIDHNLIARTLNFSRLLDGEIHPHNPAWFVTGKALPKFNGVVHATLSPDEIDRQIVAALRPFKELHQPVTWWVGPTSAPSDLGKHLQQQHRFHHNRDMIGMAVNLEKLSLPNPAPPLTFSPVRDRAKLEEWYEVMLEGFPIQFDQQYLDALADTSLDVPEEQAMHHYVGEIAGRVVAISSLSFGGGVAGLYNLTTLPKAREHGIGAWMTVRTYFEARARGYRVGTLQTTYPNALRMYHRLGFEVYCKISIYRRPA